MPQAPVRVRIAPSPTGNLHVGTARTALFNYLFAKKHGGQFILRIEDTDVERSQAAYVQNIYDGLRALNLSWDEGPDIGGDFGPYQQTDRLDLYQQWAQKLIDADLAYYCYLSPEELDAERAEAKAANRPYVYSGKCRDPEVREALAQDPARKPSLRFRIADDRQDIVFQDQVRGELRFDSQLIGDFVLMKSNGTPSYNFAVVVDDITMQISHVIRGEDHISNTPKQILLFEAFNAVLPQFAHVSMILAPDRSKLSKRHGATAVSEFVANGYLPEAFCNFIALLGWSPDDGQEIADLAHIAQHFDLARLAHSGAIFDTDKLNWVNSTYIRQLPLDELLERSRPFLAAYDLTAYSAEQLETMLAVVREPIHQLNQLPEAVDYFFGQAVSISPTVQAEALTSEAHLVLTELIKGVVPQLTSEQTPADISQILKTFCNSLKPMKTKTVMWGIRASLTGRIHGADLGTTLWLLGPERISYRAQAVLDIIPSSQLSPS